MRLKITCTRYSGVVDKEQKKLIDVFNGSFLSNFVVGPYEKKFEFLVKKS